MRTGLGLGLFLLVSVLGCRTLSAAPEVLIGDPIAFRDDFDTDSLSHYRVVGNVAWDQDHLLIPEKSIVAKQIALAPQFRVAIELALPTHSSGPSINRINFPFGRRVEAIFRIARGELDGVYQVQVEAFAATRDEDGSPSKPNLIARFRRGLPRTDHEAWEISFHYGLAAITLNGKPLGTAFIESDGERCAGAYFSADSTPLHLCSLAIDGMPTETSPDQRSAWVACEKLSQEAESLNWTRFDRWLYLHRQQVEVLREKCGPDFYAIGFKEQAIANRLSLLDESDKAIAHFDAAQQVLSRSLGKHHPRTLEVKIQAGCQRVLEQDFASAMKTLLESAALMLRIAGPFGPTAQRAQEDTINALRHCEQRFCKQRDFVAALQAAARRNALYKIRWQGKPNASFWAEQDLQFLRDLANATPDRRTELEEVVRWRKYAGSSDLLDSPSLLAMDRYQRQRESLAVHKNHLGQHHPLTLRELIHTSISESERGEFGVAITICRAAIAALREVVGINHPAYAEGLVAMAKIHSETERFDEASDGFAKASEIIDEVSTSWDWLKATMLLERGQHRMRIGELKAAEQDLRAAATLLLHDGNETTPAGIAVFERLAAIYQAKQERGIAKTLLNRHSALVSARHGRDSEAYFSIVLTEAAFAVDQQTFALADVKYTLARKLALRFFGPNSNAFRSVIEGEFLFRVVQGNHQRATQLLAEIVDFKRRRREQLFDVYSTAEQFSRSLIDHHSQNMILRLAALEFLRPAEAYTMVLETKGAVAQHQRRQAIARSNPDLLADDSFRTDVDRLREISQWLSDFGGGPSADPTRYWQLFDERLEIQRRIAAKSRQTRGVKPRTSVETICDALQPDTLVIDYVLYFIPKNEAQPVDSDVELRMAAFAYSESDPVDLVDLGPVAAIEERIISHRQLMLAELTVADEAAANAARGERQQAGIALRKLILDPVLKQLKRKQPPTSLVISPAGPLTICSFAALPTNDQGGYLIERMAISYTIAPQLLTSKNRPARERDESKVVVVGSVDYGERMLGQNFVFERLPDQEEVEFVSRRFREKLGPDSVVELLAAEADEQDLREALPNARYVHVSTHGFCIDSAELDFWGRDVDSHFVSGIALAEANSAMGQIVGLQGILWDQEIATIDWTGTELVVLSACKTALGDLKPGEGMQGLHRALSIGGATSSITTLWNAHNDSTIALVKRFYENLFNKELSKSDSLRQAQLDVLHHYRYRPEARGATASCPPALWAEFVLYGSQ